MGSMDQILETHFLRDQLFLLWPKLDLCLINAQETSIHSIRMLHSIVETLAESYGLEIDLEVEGIFINLKFKNLKCKTIHKQTMMQEKKRMIIDMWHFMLKGRSKT